MVQIKTKETLIFTSKYRITSSAIHRTQFPHMLSWIYTVYEEEDLNLNLCVASFYLGG